MTTWESYKQTMKAPATLWSAARDNDVASLASLLASGASIDEGDHRGYSPLMLAAYGGNLEAFEFLLAAGADPNGADHAGNSILMGAAFKGHLGLVRRLLAAGADPGARNASGLDARAFALTFGRAEVVALLDAEREPARHSTQPTL